MKRYHFGRTKSWQQFLVGYRYTRFQVVAIHDLFVGPFGVYLMVMDKEVVARHNT